VINLNSSFSLIPNCKSSSTLGPNLGSVGAPVLKVPSSLNTGTVGFPRKGIKNGFARFTPPLLGTLLILEKPNEVFTSNLNLLILGVKMYAQFLVTHPLG